MQKARIWIKSGEAFRKNWGLLWASAESVNLKTSVPWTSLKDGETASCRYIIYFTFGNGGEGEGMG